MHISSAHEKMLEAIQEKTLQGKLTWKEDAEVDAFSTMLPSGYKLRTRIDAQRTRYVTITNSEGREIFQFTELKDEKPTIVFRVAQAAKESALGLTEALDVITNDLSNL